MNALDRADVWRSAFPRLTFLPLLEAALAVIAILLFSQALLGPLLVDPLKPDAAEALRLVWLPVYGVTFTVAMRPLGAARNGNAGLAARATGAVGRAVHLLVNQSDITSRARWRWP